MSQTHKFFPAGPYIMGIVNVTPDSFSDGGQFIDPQKAIAHGHSMFEQGAHVLDVGGESTRPGAVPVSIQEEIDRVCPVIEGLKGCGALISVDTRHAQTMKAAIQVGAGMINDVTALTDDPDGLDVAAQFNGALCLMHMKGKPQTMQESPEYDDVVREVHDYLLGRIDACVKAGIARDRISVDPGIGFGKTLEQNISLLKSIDVFTTLGVPVLLGVSRKSFIGHISGEENADKRLPGSLVSGLSGVSQGAKILRVHDVAETKQALDVFLALQ